MAICKACPTILRSGNKTGYCALCAPLPPMGGGITLTEESDDKQWERLLMRIYTEVAIAFLIAVKILEKQDVSVQTDGHLVVYLLLTEFFHISADRISQYLEISTFQLASALEDACKRHQQDTDFRERYDKARGNLSSIRRDTLPDFIDPAVLPVMSELPDAYEPAIRFTRTAVKPKGAHVRTPRQVDIAS